MKCLSFSKVWIDMGRNLTINGKGMFLMTGLFPFWKIMMINNKKKNGGVFVEYMVSSKSKFMAAKYFF